MEAIRPDGLKSECRNAEMIRHSLIIDAHNREIITCGRSPTWHQRIRICDIVQEALEARFGRVCVIPAAETLSDACIARGKPHLGRKTEIQTLLHV
ncbi:hypothetical protein [Sphingomonas jeddahensis]|uniref:hypothetical protein n=1 Tax=Sphingomonas jeddahensis TaxID=1915074 RepID=UPI0009779766|nr:hypothetical protein [Sphingomonas jeddahensis]